MYLKKNKEEEQNSSKNKWKKKYKSSVICKNYEFFLWFSRVRIVYMPITASLSLTSSTTCCTKLKLWHVCRWLFINNSADVSYTLSPMFRSRMKRKSVKEIDVRCRKSVKCVFFAVPDGNSYFLYNIFLRGKICNSG